MQLSKEVKEFLTHPYREAFMTSFTLGSNKLKFHGNPITMSKKSKLIESMLPNLAAGKGPHELFTFKEVSEKVATLVWITLEGYNMWLGIEPFSIEEYLQTFHLLSYLDMYVDHFSYQDFSSRFCELNDEDTKKLLEDGKTEDILMRSFNHSFSSGNCGDYNVKIGDEDYSLDEAIFLRLTKIKPELVTRGLSYIPIYIGKCYKAYADRKKIMANPNEFFGSNGWWSGPGKCIVSCEKDKQCGHNEFKYVDRTNDLLFTTQQWGPDAIIFEPIGYAATREHVSTDIDIHPVF